MWILAGKVRDIIVYSGGREFVVLEVEIFFFTVFLKLVFILFIYVCFRLRGSRVWCGVRCIGWIRTVRSFLFV